MKIQDEILVNKYGQNLVVLEQLTERFSSLDLPQKRLFLNDILNLILQSKPREEDIQLAIQESKLKPTYTPCVLLKKGVANHNLQKLIELPEFELKKSFMLLINLFRISYFRRFLEEGKSSGKWWYSDLSDIRNVESIIKEQSSRLG